MARSGLRPSEEEAMFGTVWTASIAMRRQGGPAAATGDPPVPQRLTCSCELFRVQGEFSSCQAGSH